MTEKLLCATPHGVKLYYEDGALEMRIDVPKLVTDDVAADLIKIEEALKEIATFTPEASEGYSEMLAKVWTADG